METSNFVQIGPTSNTLPQGTQQSDNVARYEQSQGIQNDQNFAGDVQNSGVCPGCGRCPHCGRGWNTQPYWYWQPYQPWYPSPLQPSFICTTNSNVAMPSGAQFIN